MNVACLWPVFIISASGFFFFFSFLGERGFLNFLHFILFYFFSFIFLGQGKVKRGEMMVMMIIMQRGLHIYVHCAQ